MGISGVASFDREGSTGQIANALRRCMYGRYNSAELFRPSKRHWMVTSRHDDGQLSCKRLTNNIVVTIDGRLDNRSDIIASLRLEGGEPCSDSDIIAHGYHFWGECIFEKLIGDWAIALYDLAEDRLLLAADYPGVRTLYYAQTSNNLIWATDVDDILRCGVSDSIDEQYLSEFITRRVTTTPYKHVVRLDGGTGLSLSSVTMRRFRHFVPPVGNQPRDVVHEEQASRFRSLLWQAVSDRLEGDKRFALELSGGLDTSSIVCLADLIWKQRNADPQHLVTVTYASADPMFGIDQQFASAVNERVQFRNIIIDDDSGSLYAGRPGQRSSFPVFSAHRYQVLTHLFASERTSLLLSGHGGDATGWVIVRPYASLADLWRERSVWALLKELKKSSIPLQCSCWHLFWKDVVGFKKLLTRPTATWLRRKPRVEAARWTIDAPPSVQLFHYNLEDIRVTLAEEQFHMLRPIRASYPFLDRRLIEYAYKIPSCVRTQPGKNRVLHRAAMQGVLPPLVLNRTSKAVTSGIAGREFSKQWKTIERAFGRDCRLAQYGIVDPRALTQAAALVRDTGRCPLPLAVFRALTLELWLRQREGGSKESQMTAP